MGGPLGTGSKVQIELLKPLALVIVPHDHPDAMRTLDAWGNLPDDPAGSLVNDHAGRGRLEAVGQGVAPSRFARKARSC